MSSLMQILHNQSLNLSINPFGTDKGDFKSYILGFYEEAFLPKKTDEINILEIGFRHGASLNLWATYFQNGHVFGVDNLSDRALQSHLPNAEWINKPNITIFYADAYSKDFANSLNHEFDFIIDDGPHSLESQLRALDLYLPLLKDHGLLVIEDIQSPSGLTLFWFLRRIPLSFKVSFLDFRKNGKSDDDIMLVVKKSASPDYLGRTSLWLRALAYVPLELHRYFLRFLRKGFYVTGR